jgi:hypothetical protein
MTHETKSLDPFAAGGWLAPRSDDGLAALFAERERDEEETEKSMRGMTDDEIAAAMDRAHERIAALDERMCDTIATTAEGLFAQVQLLEILSQVADYPFCAYDNHHSDDCLDRLRATIERGIGSLAGMRPAATEPAVGLQSLRRALSRLRDATSPKVASAGQPPANLAAAEAELAELRRSETLKLDDDEIYRFVATDAWIAATPPSTLSEVAIKLRCLCDPDSGIEPLRGDRDIHSLRQVLSFVEALCSADDLKGAGTPDAAALTLFQDWIDLCHRRDEAYEAEEDDKAERLGEQRDDVEAKIASVRGSRAADAIKTFLLVMNKIVQVCGPGGQLRDASLIGDNMITNVLCDAAAVVPQLAELCAPIIHADARLIDADIEVGFLCELPTTNNERWRAERRSKLIAALDCIDATEAKTERGAAIKARWRRGELLASE